MSDYYDTLERWQTLQESIKHLQDEERALRQGLFSGSFPNPVEGTNTIELPDGRKLKAVYKIYRNVLEDDFQAANFPKKIRDTIFKEKHDLRVSAYKALDKAERKAIDAVLDIKPAGLATLSVVEAKPEPADLMPA